MLIFFVLLFTCRVVWLYFVISFSIVILTVFVYSVVCDDLIYCIWWANIGYFVIDSWIHYYVCEKFWALLIIVIPDIVRDHGVERRKCLCILSLFISPLFHCVAIKRRKRNFNNNNYSMRLINNAPIKQLRNCCYFWRVIMSV